MTPSDLRERVATICGGNYVAADAAIALVLEEAAKKGVSLARTHYDNRADAIMEYVAAIRSMKGKP